MNEAPKHTLGPLEVCIEQYAIADTGDYDYAVTIYKNGDVIAHIVCDEAIDYAPLFAAAPKMLEALKIMTQWNVEYEEQRSLNDPLPTEIRDALAIIAKAEGTTNNQQTKGV